MEAAARASARAAEATTDAGYGEEGHGAPQHKRAGGGLVGWRRRPHERRRALLRTRRFAAGSAAPRALWDSARPLVLRLLPCRCSVFVALLSFLCCRYSVVVTPLSCFCCRGSVVVAPLSWLRCRCSVVVAPLSFPAPRADHRVAEPLARVQHDDAVRAARALVELRRGEALADLARAEQPQALGERATVSLSVLEGGDPYTARHC